MQNITPPLTGQALKEQQAKDNTQIITIPSIFSNRVVVLSGSMITKLCFGEAIGPHDTQFNNVIMMLPTDAILLADTIYQSYGLEIPAKPIPN